MNVCRELAVVSPAKLLTTNAERRLHWADRARIVKAWRSTASVMALVAKLPHFDHAEIVVDIEQAHGRLADGGNHYPCVKACIDGLVDAHVLDNDDRTHVTQLVQNPPSRGQVDQITLHVQGVVTPAPERPVDRLQDLQLRRARRVADEQARCPHVKRIMGVCIECGHHALADR